MIDSSKWSSLAFATARLELSSISSYLGTEATKPGLLSSIVSLLSPSVVQSLPPYFHEINTDLEAEVWLMKMQSESHLFTVTHKELKSVIGFLFLYESEHATAHLGYLICEKFWHQGYGSELLLGLVETCRTHPSIDKLVGGVDAKNIASTKLLDKVGFVANQEGDNGVTFYEYRLD